MRKTAEHATDFVEWDVRNWSTALHFWSAHSTQKFPNCLALELGSRNGGLSMWLALKGTRVVCSDIVVPSVQAIQKHQACGVSHLIQYECLDATDIPYENHFDIILFKSVLAAVGTDDNIESQAKAVRNMHKALKRGGELFFAENLIATRLHQALRRKFVEWGSTCRYVSVDEMEQFLSCFSSVEYRTVGFLGAFGRRETQRNFLGIVDEAIFNRIVPEHSRYIIVGVARK